MSTPPNTPPNTPVNTFKHAIKAGQPQYGFWLGLCSPLVAELCSHTGYDWLLVDGEHAPNDIRTVLAQLQAIAATPTQAVVRLVDSDINRIKQYLDIGAQTLLIPMVETAGQAQQLVRAISYPPAGIRGVGTALARAAHWNMNPEYFATVDRELCLLIQIETVRGLDNLDEILRIERIDGVFIGPADLAASMGHLGNPAHPDVKAAIAEATRKILAAGKAAGSLATTKAASQHCEQMGMQFIALGVDALALAKAARDILADHRDTASLASAGNGAY